VRKQPVANVARFVRQREQLRRLRLLGKRQPNLILEERDLFSERPRAKNLPQHVARRIGDESRFVDAHRKNVAPSAAADENLAAAVTRSLEKRGLGAARGGKDRGHRTGRTRANDDDAPWRVRCEWLHRQ